jgi:hypothetical protein
MNTYQQQGDVLIFPVDKIPKTAKPVKGATLALGEFTGHHHTLFDTVDAAAPASNNPFEMGSATVNLFEDGEYKYAQVTKEVYLKHQEHKPIRIDPGTYRIGIVREVDPFSDEIRSVQD